MNNINKNCRVCGVTLTNINTYESLLRVGNYICKYCHGKYSKNRKSHSHLPYGSEIKLHEFESFCLQHPNIEEFISINPDDPMMETNNGETLKGMTTIGIKSYPNAKVCIVDKNKNTSTKWFGSGQVLDMSYEQYFLTIFSPSNKKTLLLLHLAGTKEDRRFYTPAIFNDIKTYRPNIIIVFVVLDEWAFISEHPDTKETWIESIQREDLCRRGFIECKAHPTRCFFNWKDELEARLKMKFNIICRKRGKGKWRDLILVSLE